jgi:hypothetical protein
MFISKSKNEEIMAATAVQAAPVDPYSKGPRHLPLKTFCTALVFLLTPAGGEPIPPEQMSGNSPPVMCLASSCAPLTMFGFFLRHL